MAASCTRVEASEGEELALMLMEPVTPKPALPVAAATRASAAAAVMLILRLLPGGDPARPAGW
eukprot:11956606-Prorocentrum_lima.AAC.1